MKNKITKYACSLMLVPLLLGAEAQATIYKCVKANADVYYNDKPCPVNDEESQINAVKDPEGGYVAPKFVSDDKESGANGVVVGKDSKRKIDNRKLEESNSEEAAKSGKSMNTAGGSNVNNESNQTDSVSAQQGATSSVNSFDANGLSKKMKKFTVTEVEPFK